MTSRLAKWVLVTATIAAAGRLAVLACSEGTPDLVMMHPIFPTDPEDKAGAIGVVQPSFARRYLAVAYRKFNGLDSPNFYGREAVDLDAFERHNAIMSEWLEARQAVPRTTPVKAYRFDTYRSRDYTSYANCGEDALVTATRTLKARAAQYGAQSAAVREWAAGQEAVFDNCGEEFKTLVLPTSLDPATSEAWLIADRAYQTAAAYFYAGDVNRAEALFRAIGDDSRSPWRALARMAAARCVIRRGMLFNDAGPARTDALTRADGDLRAILNDRSLESVHRSTRQLLAYVGAHRSPLRRAHELSAVLTASPSPERQDWIDYTYVLDRLVGDRVQFEFDKVENVDALVADDLMTDWIVTFQGSGDAATARAVSRWRATHTVPWLIAVLSKAKPNDAAVGEALDEAARVPAQSPAFQTVLFLRIRTLAQRGARDQARRLLAQAPTTPVPGTPTEAVNLFKAERFMLAQSLDEFLRAAPRMPVDTAYGFDVAGTRVLDTFTKPAFDMDATSVFDNGLPLSRLVEAARSAVLPPRLRRFIVEAAFVRAVMLRRDDAIRDMAELLRPAPLFSADATSVLSATSPVERHDAAILLILRRRNISAFIPYEDAESYERDAPVEGFKGWWCGFREAEHSINYSNVSALPRLTYGTSETQPPEFLSAQERQAITAEFGALSPLGPAPNYLADEAVAWAQRAPKDERAAEALARAIQATRWGCTDYSTTGRHSQRAFQTLHRLYPNSEWAKQTKYWYNGN